MIIELLRAELAREAKTTRRMLERVPFDRADWKPHAKSFSVGALASHLVDCMAWVHPIFADAKLEFDVATYRPFEAASAEALLEGFDAEVGRASDALAGATDESLVAPWRLEVNGQLFFERPRLSVVRDMTLGHSSHHRGQLSVYLRMLDIPVPDSYGPTADSNG